MYNNMSNLTPANQTNGSLSRLRYSVPVLITLIDMALLIGFLFIYTTHSKPIEGKLEIPLPVDRGCSPYDCVIYDEVRITIKHNKDNPLQPYLRIGGNSFSGFDALYREIAAINQHYLEMNINLPFKIDADPEVPTQMVVDVINACKKAGVNRIEFARLHLNRPDKKPVQEEDIVNHAEDAVLAGLIWLARHQSPYGSWGAKTFTNQCKGTACTGTGEEEFDIGVTGLSLLAFTSAGYTPSSKDIYEGFDFGLVVRKAANYLMSIQDNQGIYGFLEQGKFMYNQAIAAYAICDLYGIIKDSPTGVMFKDTAQKGVNYLVSVKNPGKGWRYQPQDGQNDSSVTGWATMALKSAELAGLNVDPNVFAEIKSFYDDVTDPNTGEVRYTELTPLDREPAVQPTTTAIGIMVHFLIDRNRSGPLVQKGVGLIMKSLPVWDTSKEGIIDYCYWFFGSYYLNYYDGPDGPCWQRWNEQLKEVLVKNQRPMADKCAWGSWEPIDRWSEEGGRVYATAINTLTLEVYYKPIITRLGSPR